MWRSPEHRLAIDLICHRWPGAFIALIGLVDAGFVRRTGVGPVPVELGTGGVLVGWPVLVFAFGLVLVIALWVRQVKGAILI